jgi:hypothetical protein
MHSTLTAAVLSRGTGLASIGAKPHLVASQWTSTRSCSRYVADLLVKRAYASRAAGAPRVVFELSFFVEIERAVRERRSAQLTVCGLGYNDESWVATPVSNLDPKEVKAPEILGAWASSIAWNQGGYDAVLLTSEGGRQKERWPAVQCR